MKRIKIPAYAGMTSNLNRLIIMLVLLPAIWAMTSCNLRENVLLPPNLTPEDYIQSSLITSKANYLIKSTNDNSYLLIDQQAITDSIIQIGDAIAFQETVSFAGRDTLHIAYQTEISPSLGLFVIRNGVSIALTFPHNYPYITCYTDLNTDFSSNAIIYCLNLYIWLDGNVSFPAQYAKNRISYHPFGTGSNQLFSTGSVTSSVSFTANPGNHYVWMNGTQDRVSLFLPVTIANTEIEISSIAQLDSVSTNKIQGVFLSFAIFSSIIDIQASQPLGTTNSAPLIKMQNNALPNRFPLQWIVVAPNQLFAWESSPETWVMTGNDLIAPCRFNGTYLLIVPLENQSELNIPLDVGLKQIYARNFWFDLQNVNSSGTTLNIQTDFTATSAFQNYFSGHPYTLSGTGDKLKLSFTQNGVELKDLPSSNWIELGFMPAAYSSSKSWVRYYENSTESFVSYKTSAPAYDASHYSYANGFIYTSVTGSGDYVFSQMSISDTSVEIPFLKPIGKIQMDKATLAWDNIQTGITLNLDYDYTGSTGYQSYFSGHPYSLNGAIDKLRLSFYQNGTKLYNLPSSAWIELGFIPSSVDPDNRWIRFYEGANEDLITYKTLAGVYDETHFSYAYGMVYSGIVGSGDYTFGQMNIDNESVEIPVLKTIGEFQMDKANIVWDNTPAKGKHKQQQLDSTILSKAKSKTQFSSVKIDFNPQNPLTHPWLNSHPFQIQNPYEAIKVVFKSGGAFTSELPPYLYLDYVVPSDLNADSAVLFSDLNSDYKATFIILGATADIDHFTQSNNRVTCFPAFGGSIIHGNITNLASNSFDISMYQKMSLNFYAIKIWMSSINPVADGTSLNFSTTAQFNDPQNILPTQYNLTQTSPAYNISVTPAKRNSRSFYTDNQPLVYLKRNARRNELLIALIQDYNYRIYPYGQASVPDGWNYAVEGNYNLFYLTHNGQFATFTDNNPHNVISQNVTAGAGDLIVSLYQAEFFLPSYFYANATPVGTQVSLENLTDLSSVPGALSATILDIRDTSNQTIQTNFLSSYLTTSYPLLYVPFPYQNAGQNISFWFKDSAGVTTQFTQVTAFSANALTEYMIVGNCAVCFPNNPGTFYTTVSSK
jgi:hypothetical protein